MWLLLIEETQMSQPLIDPKLLDHPEHFDDEIRAYKSCKRYVPTALAQQLFELAGHRCTICSAPWLEIHHIEEISEGGKTEHANLIVLCPNCHTRVHASGTPGKDELRHYKRKQEIASELPVISRLSEAERAFIRRLAAVPLVEQFSFSPDLVQNADSALSNGSNASTDNRENFRCLLEFGMVGLIKGMPVKNADGKEFFVGGSLQPTAKGVRWVNYLADIGRLP